MNNFKRHFPSNKEKWKIYLKVFIPIIMGSTMFALNGVVDNFMVGHIDQGQTALGAINSWTGILMGWFAGTAASGSVLSGQFYHAKKYDTVKQISRYRYYLSIIPAILLAIIAWTHPDLLTKVFVHHPDKNSLTYASDLRIYQDVLQKSTTYAHVIAIQWILIAITFNLGNQIRELGFGVFTLYWGIGALMANITLNSILMYVVGMGVDGAAWASVSGRIISLSSGIAVVYFKKMEIGFKPWTVFNTSIRVRKMYWKRWVYSMAVFTVTFFVIYRSSIYSLGYKPTGSTEGLGIGVGGLSIVALTGALMNIFTTTFNSLTSMSAKFVASELGKNNLKQAKINSDELKGFATLISAIMSLVLVAFAFTVPHLTFLAKDQYINNNDISLGLKFDGHAQLTQVSHSLFVIAFYYPIWIWFSVSYRTGNAGGKGGVFSAVDWIISGLQLLWLWLIVSKMVPGWTYAERNFWVTYALFFLSDLLKLIFQEYFYYKYKWLHSITKEDAMNKEAKAKDISELTYVNRRMR